MVSSVSFETGDEHSKADDFHGLREENRREKTRENRGEPFLSFDIAQFDAASDGDECSYANEQERDGVSDE